MFRRDQIDIMHVPDLLQLEIPLPQLFRRETEPVPLVRNIVVLAEDAAEIAAGEEDAAAAIVALDARLFAEMRRDGVHDDVGPDQAGSRPFEPVDTAEARAKVAVPEVRVRMRSLFGGIDGGEELVAGKVVV